VETGLRLSEALDLTWANVSFEPKDGAQRGYVYVAKGKSKYAERYVPLTGTARACLAECKKHSKCDYVFTIAGGRRRMSRHWASEQFREIRDKLKLPWDCVIHSCRHTFCTRLGERGADAFTIQKAAGHRSITISQRYVHPTPERLESAIGLLEARDEDFEE
jgi:integrase